MLSYVMQTDTPRSLSGTCGDLDGDSNTQDPYTTAMCQAAFDGDADWKYDPANADIQTGQAATAKAVATLCCVVSCACILCYLLHQWPRTSATAHSVCQGRLQDSVHVVASNMLLLIANADVQPVYPTAWTGCYC